MNEIIILAAGSGKRFRQQHPLSQHKLLAPIWDDRGTLSLLLTNLRELGLKDDQITLVTGFLAAPVLHEASKKNSNIKHFHNKSYETDSMFNSLQGILKHRPPTGHSVWVLFADTLYTRSALAEFIRFNANIPAVALMAVARTHHAKNQLPHKHDHCDKYPKTPKSPEIGVIVSNNFVLHYNVGSADCTHTMAHAVFWPQSSFDQITGASQHLTSQWQLLEKLPATTYLTLAPYSAQDIDTPEQLDLLRPNISTDALHYFKQDLNKDQRSALCPDTKQIQIENGIRRCYYVKHCESNTAADHEALVLNLLQKEFPKQVPQVYHQENRSLFTDVIDGIRFYDLLRNLKTDNPKHEKIRIILNHRCNDRLISQQNFLRKHATVISNGPYPFELKSIHLLQQLCTVLRLPHPPLDELTELDHIWKTYCAVPFRDATPKNIIIAAPEVKVTLPATMRKQAITALLAQSENFWEQIDIVDVDYTSTYHLTSLYDDQISLHGHACNAKNNIFFKKLLEAGINSPELDLALFVRYLRFGGRKLMYLLLNPTGYRSRFRYDDPVFYFQALPTLLSANFKHDYPYLMNCLNQIHWTTARFKGFIPNKTATDYFLQSQSTQPQYWQESPLELLSKTHSIEQLSNLPDKIENRQGDANE